MSNVSTYLQVTEKMLEARSKGQSDLEDSLLDQLDDIWRSLSEDDIKEIREFLLASNRKSAEGQ